MISGALIELFRSLWQDSTAQRARLLNPALPNLLHARTVKDVSARQSAGRGVSQDFQTDDALYLSGCFRGIFLGNKRILITRHPISFWNASVLVAGLPMSPLTIFAAVNYETTPGTSREL